MLLEVITGSNLFSDSIYMSKITMEQLRYSDNEIITLSAGCCHTEVKVESSEKILEPNKVFIPENIVENINLPKIVKLYALNAGDKQLKIGPFLGFLITRNRKAKRPPYSSQRHLLELFSTRAFTSGVIPVVFTPHGIDWPNQKITGHVFLPRSDGSKVWEEDTFPFPNVVYNRILNRTTENKDLILETIKNLKNIPGLEYFNPRFLNKWETHVILSRNPVMHKYLPDTTLVNNISDIVRFLHKHSEVYVKPINGSLGKNIIKLQITDAGYFYRHRKRSQNLSGIWPQTKDMVNGLRNMLGKRMYIVQQSLDLLEYNGKVFDVRLLLQKNITGEWEATSIVGRVAQTGSLFPNIAAGGEAKEMNEIWKQISPHPWNQSEIKAKLLDLGANLPKTLEEELGNFSELGLDIGLGKEGTPWLIEVNSKPSRKVFPKTQPQWKMKSIQNIIDYTKYLSGFVNPPNDAGEANGPAVYSD